MGEELGRFGELNADGGAEARQGNGRGDQRGGQGELSLGPEDHSEDLRLSAGK